MYNQSFHDNPITYNRGVMKQLIDCISFLRPFEKISLATGHLHCRWRVAKFRTLLGDSGSWTGKNVDFVVPYLPRQWPLIYTVSSEGPSRSLITSQRNMRTYLIQNPYEKVRKEDYAVLGFKKETSDCTFHSNCLKRSENCIWTQNISCI